MKQLSDEQYFLMIAELLNSGQAVHLKLRGMSMFPFLMQNDEVVVSPIKHTLPKPGDIIVFTINNTWVAHRLIKIESNFCYSRGDGNIKADKAFAIGDLRGVVTGIVKSRWRLARYSTSSLCRLQIYTGFFTGPLFYLAGIVSYKIMRFLGITASQRQPCMKSRV